MKIIQISGLILFMTLSFGALAQENKELTQQQLDSIAQATEEIAEEIYDLVEVMPQFPGGSDSLQAFFSKNMVYPDLAKEFNISGTVYMSVVVERDGSLSFIKVIRGIGGGCDETAILLIQKMPRWAPGTQRGIPVRTRVRIPVVFKLK